MGAALLSFGPGLSEQLEQTPPILSGLGQCKSGYIRKQSNSIKKTTDYRQIIHMAIANVLLRGQLMKDMDSCQTVLELGNIFLQHLVSFQFLLRLLCIFFKQVVMGLQRSCSHCNNILLWGECEVSQKKVQLQGDLTPSVGLYWYCIHMHSLHTDTHLHM